MQSNSSQNAKKTILKLLDNEEITKKDIFEHVENEYGMASSEIRNIVREIRADFLHKLNVLQSGVIRL